VLDDLKTLISKSPVLASSEPSEILHLYVMATTQVISAALVVEQEELRHVYKVQRPVYYISKVFFYGEIRYSQVQKLLYAILITKRKLLHYFESHSIHVVTSFGLGEVVENRLTTDRITRRALELTGLDITYVPQTTIKSQALAHFVAEWIETQHPPSLKSIGACISMAPSPSVMPREALCLSLLKEINSLMLFDCTSSLPTMWQSMSTSTETLSSSSIK
jgi:hypothetical protein